MSCAPDALGKTTYRVVAACLLAASSLLILPTGVAAQDPVPGVKVVPDDGLPVPEGGSAEYTVELNTAPAMTEIVTITLGRSGSGGDADLTAITETVTEGGEYTLTFNNSNWDIPQTVTVSAKEDDDGVDGIAAFTHSVTSSDMASDYDGIGVGSARTFEEDNDPIGVTVSAPVLVVPEGGSAQYTVVLDTKPTDSVRIEPDPDALGDTNLTVSPAVLTFTVDDWYKPQTITVWAAEDTDRLDGTTIITHSVFSDEDDIYDQIDDASPRSVGSVTAIEDDDERNVIQARFRRLNAEILSKHALTVADAANRTIGERMDDPCGEQAAAYTLAGGSTLSHKFQSNARTIEDGTLTLEDVLAGSSFRLPLAAANDDRTGGGPVVWGRGERQVLESEESAFAWDGTVLTGQIGIDSCLLENLLTGFALSRSIGEFDYSDGTGPAPVSGDYESRMSSMHPYFGWSSPQGLGLWAALGFARGEIEIDDAVAGRQMSDTSLRTAATGASGPVMSDGSLIAGGTTTLMLKGEALVARAEVAGNDDLIEKQTVNARRLRLVLEGGHERALASGGSLTPSLELGLRHDGGDGATGNGIEIGGSLRYRDPVAGLAIEGNGRVLTGQGDYREWGLGGSFRLDPDAAGRGLSFSLTPTWGETSSGVARLWDQDVAALATDDTAANDNVPQMRLDSELGYGFGVFGGHGLLTPYGGFTLAGEGSRRYRIGSRFEIAPAFNLSLEGDHREPANDAAADRGIMLRGQLRF